MSIELHVISIRSLKTVIMQLEIMQLFTISKNGLIQFFDFLLNKIGIEEVIKLIEQNFKD